MHRKFCRTLLGFSSNTPNDIVLGELGRRPLYTLYTVRCIKFWLKMVMSQGYLNASYNMLKCSDENGRRNWVSYVKNILISYGFGYVWLAQGTDNTNQFLSIFRQRLIDTAQQNWFVSIATNTMYCSYKISLQPELYLGELQWRRHRVALARLRTGSNNLAVNRQKRQLPRNERHCLYCAQNNVYRVEDEFHFIMECPLYSFLRLVYLPFIRIPNLYEYAKLMSSKKCDKIRAYILNLIRT